MRFLLGIVHTLGPMLIFLVGPDVLPKNVLGVDALRIVPLQVAVLRVGKEGLSLREALAGVVLLVVDEVLDEKF